MSPPHAPASLASPPPLAQRVTGSVVSDLNRLAEGWRALDGVAVHPTQQYSWIRHSVANFCPDRPITILTAGHPGRPRGIAALYLRPGPGPAFCLPGASDLGEPIDLAFADAAALEQLCSSLARLDRPVLLERVPTDSPTVTALGRAFRWPAMLVRRWARPYPVVILDPSWLEPESHLNPRRRSDLRRARRRAEGLGPVRFDLAAVTPEQLPRRLEQGLQVEAAGWKRQEGTAMLVDPAAGRFFTSYAAEACQQGRLRLNLMYVGEQPVAMQLAVEVGSRLWLLKIGYDESFARCSPGNLLLLESLRDSAARGLQSVEFLGRCEPWTELWTTRERRCVSLLAYPGTLRGLSSLARDGASYAFNQLRRRFG